MACRELKRELTDADGNEHTYFVIQKPASQGEKLKFKLLAMLGPTVGQLQGLAGKDADPDAALSAFGNALSSLFEKNSPDEVFTFLQNLVIGISRDGVKINSTNFDEIYTDNSVEFYKACALVLECNFANFFKGLKFGEMLATIKAPV